MNDAQSARSADFGLCSPGFQPGALLSGALLRIVMMERNTKEPEAFLWFVFWNAAFVSNERGPGRR